MDSSEIAADSVTGSELFNGGTWTLSSPLTIAGEQEVTIGPKLSFSGSAGSQTEDAFSIRYGVNGAVDIGVLQAGDDIYLDIDDSGAGGGLFAVRAFDSANNVFNVTDGGDLTANGVLTFPNLDSSASANSDARYSTSSGNLYYQTSTRATKQDIRDLPPMLNNLLKLKPREYQTLNNDSVCQNCSEYGLIAEEVQQVIPELALYNNKGQLIGIEYSSRLITVLVKSVQEQQIMIEQQNQTINKLELENQNLNQDLTDLKSAFCEKFPQENICID